MVLLRLSIPRDNPVVITPSPRRLSSAEWLHQLRSGRGSLVRVCEHHVPTSHASLRYPHHLSRPRGFAQPSQLPLWALSRPEAPTVIQCYSTLEAMIVLCISSRLSIIPIPAISWPSLDPPHTLSYALTTGHCPPNSQVSSILMSDIQRVVKGDPSVNSLSVAPAWQRSGQ